jgi:D-glycero-alpha-D-manno-heptose-7-phosphate kinase
MQYIVSQTPLRISLFGGGTDYPSYYRRKMGATLGMTIDKYTYVNLNTISPFFDHKLRISYSKIELVQAIEQIQHPSVKGCLNYKQITTPLEIHISTDLPAKTGLGSSSAFTVGFLNALYALQGKMISKQKLAEEACLIEQTVIGENVGSQDQFHAAFGGINLFEFGKEIKVRPLIISKEKKQIFEKNLLVFYTGLTRYANEVVQEQLEKTESLVNDAYLQRLYDMVFEAEEIISQASVIEMTELLGRLLHAGWQLKKQLSTKISNSFIDQCYNRALSCGAYGGKLCGAGGGGFLAFIVPTDAIPKVREGLKDLLEVRFRIDSQGSSIIYMKE